MTRSAIEAEFERQLRAERLTEGMVRELRFHVERRWRFDFAWPARYLAVEIEGWAPFQGHASLDGFQRDCDKYNEATRLGWDVYRFTGSMVRDGSASLYLRGILDGTSNEQRIGSAGGGRGKRGKGANKISA